MTEQQDFCRSKSNIFDTGILCLFGATLMFLVIYGREEGKDYRKLLETDDVLILVIVVSRYLVQVVRLLCVIKKAKSNRKMQREIKKVDLNALELTHNNSINFHDMHKVDKLVRTKMVERHEFVEEVSE